MNKFTAVPLALVTAIGGLGALTWSMIAPSQAAERVVAVPVAKLDPAEHGRQVAVLAGGCFWGLEAVFSHLNGVEDVVSGYAGGTRDTASYAQVSTEATRHAEAVRIVYDPARISYGTLLRVFFAVAHDPSQVSGQGPDRGISYRSAVFAQTPAQVAVARSYLAQLQTSKLWSRPLTTRLESGGFFPAEAEHQDFARRNPMHPYIMTWDRPKVAALKHAFPDRFRDAPTG